MHDTILDSSQLFFCFLFVCVLVSFEKNYAENSETSSRPAGQSTGVSFRTKYPKANRKCKKACSAAGFECKEIEDAMPNKRGFIPACCQDSDGNCQESGTSKRIIIAFPKVRLS